MKLFEKSEKCNAVSPGGCRGGFQPLRTLCFSAPVFGEQTGSARKMHAGQPPGLTALRLFKEHSKRLTTVA